MIPRLEDILKRYYQSLDGKTRKPDFIYNGREYYETEWPILNNIVFYLRPEDNVIIFDKDPRLDNG